MDKSKIEWTDATWNPVTGCTKVSDGCKHCYAERTWARLSANPKTVYYGRKFTDVQCHPDRLDQPLRWKKPRRIFVNSMSDLFHEDVPDDFITDVFNVMVEAKHHIFQILTKRPERMADFMLGTTGWGVNYDPIPNIWYGVSVEDQQTADERIPPLLAIPAAVRWVSLEPMLGPVDLDDIEYAPGDFFNALDLEEWTGRENEPEVQNSPGAGALINWVVLGGESGPKARPMHPAWVRTIRDQCQVAGVPFFFKQWGEHRYIEAGTLPEIQADPRLLDYLPAEIVPGRFVRCGKKIAGRVLDGRTWDEYPS